MNAALIVALQESRGYLKDQGWHQTAQLMSVAADEIRRLNERVRELESPSGSHPALQAGHIRAVASTGESR